MNRRKFIGIAAGTIVATGTTYYLFSDKSNFASGQHPALVCKISGTVSFRLLEIILKK